MNKIEAFSKSPLDKMPVWSEAPPFTMADEWIHHASTTGMSLKQKHEFGEM